MINNEKIISMYNNLLEAEIESMKTVKNAKCLYDFEKEDPKLYHFILEIGSTRYKLYEYLKEKGLK